MQFRTNKCYITTFFFLLLKQINQFALSRAVLQT